MLLWLRKAGCTLSSGSLMERHEWILLSPAHSDEQTLRSAGSKSDAYALFEKMLERGNPPDDWDSLVTASRSDWSTQEKR